jgi:hypothetical protein
MAAKAGPTAEAGSNAAAEPAQNIPKLLEDILYPSNLNSFRDSLPNGQVRIILHTGPDPDAQREITLDDMFPFMSVQDLKLALFVELGRPEWAVPECIYLALHGPREGRQYIGGQVVPVDFTWNLPGTSVQRPFLSPAPFNLALADKVDARFVDSTGDRKLSVQRVQRERLTLEDAFFKGGITAPGSFPQGTLPTFHAYLYKDVLAAVRGPRPLGDKDWNGRLYCYFPFLATGATGASQKQLERARRLATIFRRRQQFFHRLESILEENTPLLSLTLAAVKRLQITWSKTAAIPGIEAQFYEVPVTERRPFMRLIPVEGTGISKIFLRDGKAPDLQDPNLLVQWAQEDSPSPDRDFAFAKILIRRGGFTNEPSLYSTLRLYDDGTADAIVEPPRGLKKLDPRTDLYRYGDFLVEGLKDFTYLTGEPNIHSADVVLGLRMRKEVDTPLTARGLRAKMPVFGALFQEILPLPGESPLIMLRYKLVSNFAREDKIHTFITQVMARKVLKGEAMITDLTEIVADEFQIDMDEARKRVASKLADKSQVAVVNPETKEFRKANVPGIDVAVFAQHPFYTFHLFNVDSFENLQRIVTALSVLVSVPAEDLQVSSGAAKDLAEAERKETAAAVAAAAEEAEEEEYSEAADLGRPQAAAEDDETSPAAAQEDLEGEGGEEDVPDYLDYFTFAQEAEASAEDNAAAASAAATRKEGAPFPEDGANDDSPPAAAAPPGRAMGVEDLKGALRRDAKEAAPREVLKDMRPGAAAAAATLSAQPVPENNDDEEGPKRTVSIANYFLDKLHEADRRLFDYTKRHPSTKRYVSGCQPTYGRQPAVLSEEKFQEMEDEYAKDNVVFHIYPLMPGEPERPLGDAEKEYYTVLRYGTAPQKQNYYLCSRYFCTRDEILVREVDLKSDRMRRPVKRADGTLEYPRKNPGECPFCRGKIIKSKKVPGPNETILEREQTKLSGKRHLYIGFLKKIHNPDGFYLPCCFGDELPIKFQKNPAFSKYLEWGVPPKPSATLAATTPAAAAALEAADEPVAAAGPRTEAGLPIMDYYVTLAGVARKYIVGAEKLPLEIGNIATQGEQRRGEPQIGLLPPALDSYFDQIPTELVARSANPQKLKTGAAGFLRVAAENSFRFQNDALLAAIAPYFLLNTADQLKAYILERVTPKVFVQLNYGNLVLEFYDPAELMNRFKTRKELVDMARDWAENELDTSLHQENEEALIRAYLSYTAFQAWLVSTDTKKEFRHFALMFAQSGLLRRGAKPGISFIVLDLLESGKLEVRCPPYAYNADLMAKNDVAFLFHHWSGVWEPIFFADNRTAEEGGIDPFKLLFQGSASALWPEIVKRRVQEFMTQCSTPGRAFYTAQAQAATLGTPLANALIPLSVIKRIVMKDSRLVLEAGVRDAYNHLAAVVVRVKAAGGGFLAGFFPIPVADDGELLVDKRVFMDWDDPEFERAPVDKVIMFYKEIIEPRFQIYPGYSPLRLVESKRDGQIVAVQLRNGLYVPAGPASGEAAAAKLAGSPKVVVEEMEWTINHEIVLEERETPPPGENLRLEAVEFKEIFEHFRLTFSNWLAIKEEGGKYRSTLETTIFSRTLPLFEKRKRLEILLGPITTEWLTTDAADEDEGVARPLETSLLRADCRIRGEGTCSGRCAWREAEEGKPERCLLHVPEDLHMGYTKEGAVEKERRVSAPRVMLLRLIDELLRYGERRRQLMEQDVSQLVSLEKPVTLEIPGVVSKQRIFPEKSQAWFELLRLDWAKKVEVGAKYIEEMAGTARSKMALPAEEIAAAEGAPVAPVDPESALTVTLETLFRGDTVAGAEDPKLGALRLSRAPLESLIVPLGLVGKQLELPSGSVAFTEEMIRELTRMTGRIIVQIDVRGLAPVIIAKRPFRVLFPGVPVFIVDDRGAAVVMKDPANPAYLTLADMPAGLAKIVGAAKGVLGSKPVGPAVEAVDAAVAAAAAVKPKTLVERRPAAAPVAPVPPPVEDESNTSANSNSTANTSSEEEVIPAAPKPKTLAERRAALVATVAAAPAPVAQPPPVEESNTSANSNSTANTSSGEDVIPAAPKPMTLAERRAALTAPVAAVAPPPVPIPTAAVPKPATARPPATAMPPPKRSVELSRAFQIAMQQSKKRGAAASNNSSAESDSNSNSNSNSNNNLSI